MTHNQRVLDLLADGEPHSHLELYDLHVVAHSRVSDLRRKGHVIRMWRDQDLYWYQHLGLLDDAHREPRTPDEQRPLREAARVPVSPSSPPTTPPGGGEATVNPSQVGIVEQLELEVAA